MSALLLAAFAMQVAQPAASASTPPKPNALVIPGPSSCRSLWPKVKRVKTVDIPQAAKDEGHNGRAAYSVVVDADGEVVALYLVISSGSVAIDKAVKERAQELDYSPAIDENCDPTQGSVRVSMEYARFDKESPGGGLDGYSCGDMLREQDWYEASKADSKRAFIPKLAYLVTGSLVRMEQGENLDAAMMDAELAKRTKMWGALVERCRASPDTLLLDEVEHPAMYRRQVDNR